MVQGGRETQGREEEVIWVKLRIVLKFRLDPLNYDKLTTGF